MFLSKKKSFFRFSCIVLKILAIFVSYKTIKQRVMRATVSNSQPGKIQVMTKEVLKGQGIKAVSIKSNGETRYLLTQKAYDKIADLCEWIG